MSRRMPFKIEIFVAEGRPDGLRLVQKSNWVGQAVVFPRGRYPAFKKREEFSRSGVYVLVGDDGDDQPSIYVGEAENVGKRLGAHYSGKDFWQQAIIFTQRGTLNKAQVKYLEARLVELANKYKRCHLENRNNPQRPGLTEPDEAEMEGYLDEMLSLLPVLGVNAFERAESASSGRKVFFLNAKGCNAKGFETNTGFTVEGGSIARQETVLSMEKHVPGYHRKRQQLIDIGTLVATGDGYRFTTDTLFSSPSAAASVCCGGAANGLTEWKDEAGITLKEHREKATES